MPLDSLLRVVIVEDSEAFLLRLRAALSSLPVKIVGRAATSADAVEIIDQTQPDIVLLDMFLESGSGVDVLRHMADTGSKARTLVMTSEQVEALRSACLALGAYRFLDKAELILTLEDEVQALIEDLPKAKGAANGFKAS